MVDDIIVFDDFLDPMYQTNIQKFVFNQNFRWRYESVTVTPNINAPIDMFVDQHTQETHQFVNTLFANDNVCDQSFNVFLPIVLQTQSVITVPTKLSRLKTNMLLQETAFTDNYYHTAHVDSGTPHWVMIYYIQDSDGDTVIFDQTYGTNFDQLTIKERVAPKQGRAVIFNGKYFHTSSSPQSHKTRTVLNCALEIIN